MSKPHQSSRGSDRRDRDRDRDDYPRKQPSNQGSSKSKAILDDFFLDGEGIHREVLQSSICRFLGPEATCKPFNHEEMLKDLRLRSAEFHAEGQARSRQQEGKLGTGMTESRGSDTGIGPLRYEDSQTKHRQDAPGYEAMDYSPSHPYGVPYSQGPSPNSYTTQGGNTSGYSMQYPQEPPMNPYGNAMPPPNPYAHAYSNYAPSSTYVSSGGVPAYDRGGFGSEYTYPGSSHMPQGQYHGYPQGYGESSRNPTYTQHQSYGDPSRPGAGGGPASYNFPPGTQPRMFDDQNNNPNPYNREPRPANQPTDPRYPPPGGAGPAQYDNQRDPYNRPSSDYAPPRRR